MLTYPEITHPATPNTWGIQHVQYGPMHGGWVVVNPIGHWQFCQTKEEAEGIVSMQQSIPPVEETN